MGNLIANDVLDWVSRTLIEPVIKTTLGTAVAAPGPATVTPPSMAGIYTGALLIVGSGSSQEVVTVMGTTSATFTATFVNAHPSTDVLFGCTFPSGETPMFLFTQAEMLGYLLNAQQDFLLKARLLITVDTAPYTQSVRFYTQPAQAIRIERIARQTNAGESLSDEPILQSLHAALAYGGQTSIPIPLDVTPGASLLIISIPTGSGTLGISDAQGDVFTPLSFSPVPMVGWLANNCAGGPTTLNFSGFGASGITAAVTFVCELVPVELDTITLSLSPSQTLAITTTKPNGIVIAFAGGEWTGPQPVTAGPESELIDAYTVSGGGATVIFLDEWQPAPTPGPYNATVSVPPGGILQKKSAVLGPSLSVTLDNPISVGSTLVAFSLNSGAATADPTDNLHNTWSSQQNTNNPSQASLWYAVNCEPGTTTIDFSGLNVGAGVLVCEVAGYCRFDGFSWWSTDPPLVEPLPFTTTIDNDIFIAFFVGAPAGSADISGMTAGAESTLIQGVNSQDTAGDTIPVLSEYQVVGAAGSYQSTCDFDESFATPWYQMGLAFGPCSSAQGYMIADIALEIVGEVVPTYLDLFNTSAADLDMLVENWPQETGDPTNWYQDSLDQKTFGVYPNPEPGGTFERWYSDRGPDTLALNSALAIPDIFAPALKYKVLAMAFSKDGEQRDMQRAKFCEEMYKFWVLAAVKFVRGVAAALEENQRRANLNAAMTGGTP